VHQYSSSATEPTVATLRAIVERTVRWSPELKARAEHAALIVLFRPITHSADGSYTVPSECDDAKSYQITASGCSCPDSTKRGVATCKHQLAVRFARQLGIAFAEAPAAVQAFGADEYTRLYGALA
jgi:hypothetical protein